MTCRRTPDPARLALFESAFMSVAEEMGTVLARTAYSPNIKERRDFSCAVFTADGELAAQAAHIPVHLGAMPMSVQAAMKAFPGMRRGDVVILNDPYRGGTHLPDITTVSPVRPNGSGRPLFYLATRAHHADIGGGTPGSFPLAGDLHGEGLCIPPMLLQEQGRINRTLLDIIHANVRTPEERDGDLRGQLAAHTAGEQRLLDLIRRHGRRETVTAGGDLLTYGEAMMTAVLNDIPDGRYEAEDRLDDDGRGHGPLPIKVVIHIRGGNATIDFDGSSPQTRGTLNAVAAITHAAVYYCFLCVMVTRFRTLSRPPANQGCFRPLTLKLPAGSVVHASFPAAVSGGNVETSQRIVDVVFRALAAACPDLIPAASQGTMNNLTLGGKGLDGRSPFAYYETTGGGMGARPDRPGMDAVQVHMTNTLNTPVEALEAAYPFRIEHYGIATGTGGRGQHRGGHGIRRDLRVLSDADGTLVTERRTTRPYGLQGGEPGREGENLLIRKNRKTKLPGKAELHLQTGDVIRIRTPGGGGWGNPV